MENRKKDHIELAFESQLASSLMDRRFFYEPMLKPHPKDLFKPFSFLGKKQKVPVWVSSMTGGTKEAETINKNLARACNEFGMGMGLGSCRIILDDDTYFHQFDVRKIIGDEYPLYANLGIAQIEKFLSENNIDPVLRLVDRLKADGLVIHVNPMQEWFQPEGDRLASSPLETITSFLEKSNLRIIVKEVGQGIGPLSLRALLQLPIEAIEFGAFGGTNFAKLELMRSGSQKEAIFDPLSRIGVDAMTMMEAVREVVNESREMIKCKSIIASGGLKNYLDGYYLIEKSPLPAIYGQASSFLKHARGSYEELKKYVEFQVRGLELASNYLTVRD